MSSPIISVIIPCYNAELTIEKAITSVLDQTLPNIEILVIDGMSSDHSLSVIKKFEGKIAKLISEKDKGVYDAINKGIQYSSGSWIYVLGADDYLADPNVFERIMPLLQADIELLAGRIQNVHSNHPLVPTTFEPSFGLKIFLKNTIHQQGALYKKSALPNPPFKPELKVLADYATHLSFKIKNSKVGLTNTIIATCSATGISKQFQSKLYIEEWKMKSEILPLHWLIINALSIPFKYILKKLF